MSTVSFWQLSDDAAIISIDLFVCSKRWRTVWWNMVVWMQPMWYSTDVWHKCALVCAEIKVNTNKLNVCLINPENICLRPTHHIRHIPRILVNYRYNLTNMRVVIIQLVQIKWFWQRVYAIHIAGVCLYTFIRVCQSTQWIYHYFSCPHIQENP